uniref:FBA_2 domain-containing protein n=1 Tax=Caenorhabditis tropicalis TaxID=1561998 RepID=A0A1I7UPZ9_9PELO
MSFVGSNVRSLISEPIVHDEPATTIFPAFVVKSLDNPLYMKYWIQRELRLNAVVMKLDRGVHNWIFEKGFPGAVMGNNAALVVFETNEGVNFMLNHRPFLRSIALVYLDTYIF